MQAATHQLKSVLNGRLFIPFGRFRSWRRGCSRMMRLEKRPELMFHPNNIENAGTCFAKAASTCFDPALIDACVRDLRTDGISPRLHLPAAITDALIAYAHAAAFRLTDDSAPVRDQSVQGTSRLSGLRSICSDVTASLPIMQILADNVLCQIAARYLGFEPAVVEAYLERLSSPQRGTAGGAYPPFEYHYDVPGFNFIGFFFYLTDVDENTGGAHVMIRKSHVDKPLRFLLRSARSAGKRADQYYPKEQTLTVYGSKGAGFAEDLYSFHKLIPPVGGERLTLQIRYY